MIGFKAMQGAASAGGSGGRTYNFNFTDASYTPPTGDMLIDFDPYGKPNFNFKIAGNTPPSGGAVNFNFTS